MGLLSEEKGLWSVAEEALLLRSRVGRGGSAVGGGWIPFAAALLESVTVAVHFQDVDMMGDAVEQSPGEAFGAEDLGPFFEWQV